MCTYVPNFYFRTAQEDIPCYKILGRDDDGVLHSPFFPRKTWQLGTAYTNPSQSAWSNDYDKIHHSVGYGYYHTFQNKHEALIATNVWAFNMDIDVYLCVIPAGTKYLVGHDGENKDCYAAQCLKIVGKISG